MAHNIQILENGDAAFVENSTKERAWHGLGTTFDRPLTAKEALEGCHADWTVASRNIYYPTAEFGKMLMENKPITPQEFMSKYLLRIDDKKANVREDNEFNLGIVGKDYGIVQNTDAFDFIDMLTTGKCGGLIPSIECAGVLGNGERIFITAKLPESIMVANNRNDLVDMYFVFTTSHSGEGAVTTLITPVRVVCQNTLNFAFKHNSGKLSFRHTTNVLKRLDLTNKENAERAFKCMHLYDTYKTYFEQSLNALAKIRLNDKQVENILVKTLLTPDVQKTYFKSNENILCEDIPTRSQNIIANVTEALHGGVGQRELSVGAGNGLWLINGITSFYQNHFNWGDDAERKFDAVIGGSVERKIQTAFQLINEVA
jgi:phage/plasmid-like protein (TIGR03299 family)